MVNRPHITRQLIALLAPSHKARLQSPGPRGSGGKPWRRWLGALLLPLAAWLAAPAQAAQVVFLSTAETAADAIEVTTNARIAFAASAAASGLTFANGTGALSGASALPISADTELIVAVTVYRAANAARMNELIDALGNRPDVAIVAFLDGCDVCAAYNLNTFVPAINAVRPAASWPTPLGIGPSQDTGYEAQLNAGSLYQATFAAAGLSQMRGWYYSPVTNVPDDYVLYTQSASNPNVVGLFMPQAAVNSGGGACLFLTTDSSIFVQDAWKPGQNAAIASAFTTAARDPAGACAQPAAADVPDVWPTLTGPVAMQLNTPAIITLKVSNDLHAPSSATTVTVTIPAGITLDAAPTGCTAAPPGFTCNVPALAADTSQSWDFTVSAAAPVDNAEIKAAVAPVTGEINTANNTDTHLISAPGYPDLVSAITGTTLLSLGGNGSYVVTITNKGHLDSDDGMAEIVLPAGMTLDPTKPPPSGCANFTATATGFTCTLGHITQGGHVSIFFTLTDVQALTTGSVINVLVTGVTGEQVTANNNSSLALGMYIASGAQAIPALDNAALALLALLLTAVAARQSARARRARARGQGQGQG